jgi:hypothetical protein
MTIFNLDIPEPEAPQKKRRAKSSHPEHKLQIQCHKFADENILVAHKFLGFDRSRAEGPWSHEYERRRGLESGTSDTATFFIELVPLWFELKDAGKEPSDKQRGFGTDMIALGHGWDWGDCVMDYCLALEAHGVPLRRTARINAEHLDRLLLAAKMKKVAKAPKSYRKPRQKPGGSSAMRGMARAQGRGMLTR